MHANQCTDQSVSEMREHSPNSVPPDSRLKVVQWAWMRKLPEMGGSLGDCKRACLVHGLFFRETSYRRFSQNF